jgi:hypothetical protein
MDHCEERSDKAISACQIVLRIAPDFSEFFLYWKRQLVWGVDAVGEMIGAF